MSSVGTPSHLAVGEVEIVAHFHGQRAPAAAAEVHDAVLAAAVRDIVDGEHSFTHRIALRGGGEEMKSKCAAFLDDSQRHNHRL